VVDAGTLTTFKRHLDGYMNREGIEGYGPSKGRSFFLVQLGDHDWHRLEGPKGLSSAVLFMVLCIVTGFLSLHGRNPVTSLAGGGDN